jgi:glycosyltransferase involved in cell wall biosynthesis
MSGRGTPLPAARRQLKLAYLSIGRHIHTERWLTWFARQGHEVHLLTIQPGPIPGVEVHDIMPVVSRPKPLRYALGLIKVKSILRSLRPDLLHTHFLTGYGYWGVMSGYRPFMLTVWGDDVYVTPHDSLLKNRLARKALREADYVTGDSGDIIEASVELGARRDRVEVVQWGVDFTRFNSDVSGAAVREHLGIPADAPVVLSTRSFTQPYYNIDLVVRSAARVRARHPDVHYIMAGLEGDDARFQEQARELEIGNWMHWVGRIPHEDLPAYLNTANAFLSIPSVDATAVSLLEAMACGSPIVATDLPSATEWIRDGETGLVIPPRDEDALVKAIERYLGDPDPRGKVGRQAEEDGRSRADHERNMARVEEIYYALVEGSNPSFRTGKTVS